MDNQINTKIFKPSWDTCYRPDLQRKKECEKCEFINIAICEKHKDYKIFMDEFNKTGKIPIY